MTYRFYGIASAVVFAGISVYTFMPTREHPPIVTTTSDPSLLTVQQQVEELRLELRAIKARPLRSPDHPQFAEAPLASPSKSEPELVEIQPTTTPDLSESDLRDNVSARFYEGERERVWSADSERRLDSLVRAELEPTSSLQSLECKATLCRASIQHPNLDAHKSFIERTTASPTFGWDGPFMVTLEGEPSEGATTSLAYFARPGTSLFEN